MFWVNTLWVKIKFVKDRCCGGKLAHKKWEIGEKRLRISALSLSSPNWLEMDYRPAIRYQKY